MKIPLVNVVTINYFTDMLTIRCIESIVKTISSDNELIISVFDNGSNEGILQKYIDENFKLINKSQINSDLISFVYRGVIRLDYYRSSSNLGFATACSFVSSIAKKIYNPQYYYYLNNDAIVDESAIMKIVFMSQARGDNSLISSIVLSRNGVWFEGGVYNKFFANTKHVSYQEFFKSRLKFLSGCALLVPANVSEKIGNFDESFFLYGEDLDYSLRAAKAGFKLDICFESIVWHEVGSSSSKRSFTAYYNYVSNTIGCFRKNFNILYALIYIPFHLVKCLFLAVTFSAKFKDLGGYLFGVKRGLTNFKRK
jgi:GT2 family glycosyltransferase